MILSKDDKARVVRGQVLYHGQWVSIEEKHAQENEFCKRLQEGYVYYLGEWMSIDEKIARVRSAHAPLPVQQPSQHNVYYQTLNKQTYTIQNTDGRSFQQISNEHRHVHMDPNAFGPQWPQSQQYFGHTASPNPQQNIGPLQQYPPQSPPRQIEQQLPADAPDYFYGEQEPEITPPYPPRDNE